MQIDENNLRPTNKRCHLANTNLLDKKLAYCQEVHERLVMLVVYDNITHQTRYRHIASMLGCSYPRMLERRKMNECLETGKKIWVVVPAHYTIGCCQGR